MSENKNNIICFILLNFNNYPDVERCIQNLDSLNIRGSEIIVVDNFSTDVSFSKLKQLKEKYNFKLLRSNENNGFASGNNIGIRYAQNNMYESVVIMNSDIHFDRDIFTPMVKFLMSRDEIGMVGPSIWHDNELINIGNKIHFTRISNNNAIPISKKNDEVDADFLIGACMVVKMSAINNVGMIPENYFLNYEETEWGLMFKNKGYKIKCLPKFEIYHDEGTTINKYSGMQIYFLRRNIVLFELRNAPFIKKCIFFIKLFPFSILQCIHSKNFTPLRSYYDGFTEKNRYKK